MNISVAKPSHRAPVAEETWASRSASDSGFKTRTLSVERDTAQVPFNTKKDRIDDCCGNTFVFGPFRLLVRQRLLLQGDKPVRLGSRALDLLIALIERHGELVGKDELMHRVWPKTFVEAANLTVHIAALRRALNDGRAGNRFLINTPGRGYRFVAPVRLESFEAPASKLEAEVHSCGIPAPMTSLIGCSEVITNLVAELSHQRLVTIAGFGGSGKSSVALAVADKLTPKYDDGGYVVDLASVADPRLVPTVISTALGIVNTSKDPLADLATTLSERHVLLLLDNCDLTLSAVAEVAVNVLRRAPGVDILATSREPLRVNGEHVHRLSQLACPPASASLPACDALAFPAVQLFVHRAAASLGDFALDDVHAPIVAEICRRLEGLPLAIEFAAARVGIMGVREVAAGMKDRLKLLTGGVRNSCPRHQSMRASLDWSYDLLTELDQSVLRRMSVLDGSFSLQEGAMIAADSDRSEIEIVDSILELIAKSLIEVDHRSAGSRLRLLETTRAYAQMKLSESDEHERVPYIWRRRREAETSLEGSVNVKRSTCRESCRVCDWAAYCAEPC